MEKVRLQKFMADAGVASRRKSEELIAKGHVRVNNKVVTEMGVKVDHHDKVEVDGMPLETEKKRYILMYKPRGVISAVKDNKDRKVVTDLLKEDVEERVYPIGRLDYDTSGLLLLTNDGEFANHLMHPRYHVDKTYVAKIEGISWIFSPRIRWKELTTQMTEHLLMFCKGQEWEEGQK